ncbi:hypothetical protein PAER4782_34265 (plasmid) [Pseudomonas aeruginosa]|nr:hypothetical protein PAER4782_34265 [Pseudomonas aeruginosa]CAI9912153.1 hypothetical protein PAER4782_34265 [Pseudomonas aeruginosa]
MRHGEREFIFSLAINCKGDPGSRVKAQHLTDLLYRPGKACGFLKKFSSRAELACRGLRIAVIEIARYGLALPPEPVMKPILELTILFPCKSQGCFW